MSSNNIPWDETIKKEARGIDDADFGEIQSVDSEYIITQKGIIDKEFFSFPINLVQDYDGNRVLFKVTEEEARNSYMESQNIDFDQEDLSNSEIETESTTITNDYDSLSNNTKEKEVIPLMSEKLDVTTRELVDETVITKKPVKETKTIEVQLMREEIESIERRPPSSQIKAQNPVESPEEIKIPLKREEPQVTKKPYVKEEVIVKKKAMTDKKEITEDVNSEELDTSNVDRD
ncbi:MAG TPA: YsnF/AvaK domain-containing protein [Nitrososphaeraceae archaeon]|nr:YsnF/AvaK domain-containing protein [Nitrososphaeraceae archaeon]